MSTAWMFPGHGAQYPRMGHSLFRETSQGRRWLVEAEAISGLELGVIASGARPHALKTPSVIEPLLAAVSGAYVDFLRAQGSAPAAVAGYSAGEVSAMYAAGVFDAETCLRIACKRGEILTAAAAKYPGGMMSLHGLPVADVVALVNGRGGGFVAVAAFHSPHHLTVAGEWDSLSVVVAEARAKGARAVAVDVAGPWHTPLMDPVRPALAVALAQFPFAPAQMPVWTSATGTSSTDPAVLRRALSDAVAAPVRWTAMVDGLLADGVDDFLEVGPGRTLWGLLGQLRSQRHFSRRFLERAAQPRSNAHLHALAAESLR
jgi:[acyl-carrier-protein] S-malonyltransferase